MKRSGTPRRLTIMRPGDRLIGSVVFFFSLSQRRRCSSSLSRSSSDPPEPVASAAARFAAAGARRSSLGVVQATLLGFMGLIAGVSGLSLAVGQYETASDRGQRRGHELVRRICARRRSRTIQRSLDGAPRPDTRTPSSGCSDRVPGSSGQCGQVAERPSACKVGSGHSRGQAVPEQPVRRRRRCWRDLNAMIERAGSRSGRGARQPGADRFSSSAPIGARCGHVPASALSSRSVRPSDLRCPANRPATVTMLLTSSPSTIDQPSPRGFDRRSRTVHRSAPQGMNSLPSAGERETSFSRFGCSVCGSID